MLGSVLGILGTHGYISTTLDAVCKLVLCLGISVSF